MTAFEIDKKSEEAWQLRLHDLQTSYKKATEILQLAESRNYKKGIADSSKTLGYCYWRFSDYSLSLSHSLRALEIYQNTGNKKGEADTLNNVGAVYMFQNDNVRRLEVNLRCKEIRNEIGDLEGVASSEGNIGETYFEMGDYKNAKICFENCLKDENASVQGISWAHHNLGRVEEVKGNFDQALDHFLKALEISERANYHVVIIDSYLQIVEMFINLQRFDDALKYAEKSLEVSRQIGAKEGEKKSLYYLSKIHELQGKFKASLKYHQDYHTLDTQISRDTEIEKLKTAQLKVAYDKIEEQKNQLIDSIRYAERIQTALLSRDQAQELLRDYFVMFRPKDIVSGDFYWYYEKEGEFYIAVADCTGHGVPGALLTMLGTTFLNEIIALNENPSPSFILKRLRYRIIKALSHSNGEVATDDGMDISLLKFNVASKKGEWAGAYNPLWIVRPENEPVLETSAEYNTITKDGKSLYEIKGDRFAVGRSRDLKEFTNHHVQLKPGDIAYLLTDGFNDQFGGPNGKKYRSARMKETLLEIEGIHIEERAKELNRIFDEWKGNIEQVDDVCIFGIEILVRPPQN